MLQRGSEETATGAGVPVETAVGVGLGLTAGAGGCEVEVIAGVGELELHAAISSNPKSSSEAAVLWRNRPIGDRLTVAKCP